MGMYCVGSGFLPPFEKAKKELNLTEINASKGVDESKVETKKTTTGNKMKSVKKVSKKEMEMPRHKRMAEGKAIELKKGGKCKMMAKGGKTKAAPKKK